MRPLHFILTIIVAVLLFSCSSGKDIRAFDEASRANYREYKNADIQNAENCILKYIAILSEYRNAGVEGIKYDKALGFSYVRLYLIKNERNEIAEAKKFYAKSRLYLKLASGYTEVAVDNEMPKVLEFIKSMDTKNGVKWIKK
jgi:hypothetical protein